MPPFLSQIRSSLPDNGPEETLKLLDEYLKQNNFKNENDTLDHIRIQWTNLSKRQIEGIISYEEGKLTENRINKSILEFIGHLEKRAEQADFKEYQNSESPTSTNKDKKRSKKDRTALFIAILGGVATIIAALIKIIPSLFPPTPPPSKMVETHIYTVHLQSEYPETWKQGRSYLSFKVQDLGIDTTLIVTGDHTVTLELPRSIGSRLVRLKLANPEGYFLEDSLYQFINTNQKTINILRQPDLNSNLKPSNTRTILSKATTKGEIGCLGGYWIYIDGKKFSNTFEVEAGKHKITIKTRFEETLIENFDVEFPVGSIRIIRCRNNVEIILL
ncbi:MAG: hypothetical protein MRZ79_01620 [Bacteroidia bacterium]|nr:hypothetical protein [Bacteroidia bacterium]